MDELLGLILVTIVELGFDLLAELIAAALADLASRALLGLFTGLNHALKGSRLLIACVYVLFGALSGASSLLVLPHRLLHQARPVGFHGLSLFTAPVVVGLVLSYIGAGMEKRGKTVAPIETFGNGYAFAFGMALIRFLFAR